MLLRAPDHEIAQGRRDAERGGDVLLRDVVEAMSHEGQARPRRLRIDALKETERWFDQMGALWRDSFERLDTLLRQDGKE